MGTEDQAVVASTRRPRRGMVLALLLLVVGIAGGATAGWTSAEPLYRGEVLLYISPYGASPQDVGDGGSVLPRFDGYVAFQVELLKSRRVAALALQSKDWRMDVAEFLSRRRIVHAKGTQHIIIQFQHPRSDMALEGAQALLDAFTKLAIEMNPGQENLEQARHQSEALAAQAKEVQARIQALTADYGGVEGLQIRHEAALRRVMEIEAELKGVRDAIRTLRDAEAAGKPIPPSEIALENAEMAKLLVQLAKLEARLKHLRTKLGDKAEDVVALKQEIAVLEQAIAQLADAWNRVRIAKKAGSDSIDDLRARERRLREHLDVARAQLRQLAAARADVQRLQKQYEDLARQQQQLEQLKDHLVQQLTGTGPFRVPDPGSLPEKPAVDLRPKRALRWGALGALPGLLGLLILGAVRRGSLRGRPEKEPAA